MEQVIMNLAINARDAMPKGGGLTFETKEIDVDGTRSPENQLLQPGSYILLTVTDTGRGMDKETQSHIFEPFFTTKEVGEGTGLGLSTVYGIIQQSDGHIHVSSEPEKGTTFNIYFPKMEGTPEEAEVQPDFTAEAGGSETILVVEDEPLVRGLTKSALEERGYHVLEAASGKDAIGVFKNYEGKIHLLATDVVMPGMNGRELAETVVGIRPEIKVLFMSGYPQSAISHLGVLYAGTEFLQKPALAGALARKVRAVLDSDLSS